MNQHHVRLAARAERERLPGPDRDGFHTAVALLFEPGDQRVEQTGILRAGGRREDDVPCRLRAE
jgi:hypothetical protein